MATQIDLQELAVERPVSRNVHAKPRRFGARYALPAAIVLAFAAVLVWSLRERFLPATRVTVTPVMVAEAQIQRAGTPVFQAAGWVEPRPMPIVVSAQAEGVVHELLVIEGQDVQPNEPIARLIDADAQLAVAEANATLKLRDGEVELATAALTAARAKLENPVHLQAALAEADAELANVVTAFKNLPFSIEAAEARLRNAEQELDSKQRSALAVSQRSIERAASDAEIASAELNELREREQTLQAQIEAWQRKCQALRETLELKIDEHRALAEAEAGLSIAKARHAQAQLAVKAAELLLERMTIRSPIAGRVLAIHARPGERLAGLAPGSERDASAVVSLYDPQQLQVRADVRLEDVPQTHMGQQVDITTPALAKPLHGEVVAVTSQADIQKNTLQVKIAIHDPSPVIKPEMLVQATFLAARSTQSSDELKSLCTLVPRELVERQGDATVVWVADLSSARARLQPITLGSAGTDDLIEVTDGLAPTAKLIVRGRENLEPGTRIHVTGEDQQIGN